MLKAVIFDMDGVLVDSEAIFYEADKVLLESLGKEFDKEYYKQFVGTTCEYMWKKIIKDYDLHLSVEYMDLEGRRIVSELLTKYGGFPDVPFAADFVKRLAGEDIKLAIASSSSKASIERNMDKMGIRNLFDIIVSGEEMERPKPYPDVFLAAAKMLDVKPFECIVIEDSHNGVLAAKAADMACIGYVNENSGNQDLSQADLLLLSFESADLKLLSQVHCHTFNEPFQVLETDRLLVQEMTDTDILLFKEMVEKEDIEEVTGLSSEKYRETLGNDTYMSCYRENMYKFYGLGIWALKLRENGKTIGFAGADENMMLSYIVDEDYRRKGYASEALKEIIKYIFLSTEEEYIYCKINDTNTASLKVAENLGFIKTGDLWRIKNEQ